MKSSTARATSKPTTRATTSAAVERGRGSPARARSSPSRTPARAGTSPARSRASPARNGVPGTKIPTMSAEQPITVAPRRSTSSAAPSRQAATPTRIPTYTGRASLSRGASPPLSSSLEGNSPVKANTMSATRNPAVKGSPPSSNSISSAQPKKQILSHEFLAKTTSKSCQGHSPLNRSIDEPSAHQLRRHSAPSSKLQEYLSKSHDHGSLSIHRGPKILSKSQNQGPKSLSTSQDRGFISKSQDRGFISKSQDRGFISKSQDRGFISKSQDRGFISKSQDRGFISKSQDRGFISKSQDRGFISKSQDRGFISKSQDRGFMSKSQDRGFMSKSQDRGFMSKSQDRGSYANQNSAPKKGAVPEYGYDGRRKSTSTRDTVTPLLSSTVLNRRDPVSLHLLMGRSIDSTLSFSTTTSSPTRGSRQSFRDAHRLVPLQLSDPIMSQGYRSGDHTPEDASPLDGRAPARKHRQLKSPDFFDVKKLDGDGGVITAVSRMHDKPHAQKSIFLGEEDQVANKPKHTEQRRDTLADSARKAFSVETDSAIGSSHFSSEINFKLEKALTSVRDLLEIGSWNEDDEEYLRIYKHERSGDTSFVDVVEDKPSVRAPTADNTSNYVASESPRKSKKWPEVGHLSQYHNALYQKSEPGSDFVTSTQASPQASPPRSSATIAIQPTVVSRISSRSATSIDLNRSTDTTCSTYSQYDNSFWADPPINGTFRPWNPKREAEMTHVAAPPVVPTLPVAELAHPTPDPPVLREPVATTLNESRMSRYYDGLEMLTSYMKTAGQAPRKKQGLESDDLSSSQASGCFDYLVDFLESQTSITDVLVSAHDETLKLNDFAHSAPGGSHINSSAAVKRLDSKMTNDTAMLSNRSIESRITDLGSEASWESGKSRSVQMVGSSTGKVMDQITETVDSLSFDSPKHLSTFKFGLKKTTIGACEIITSSDQQALAKLRDDASAAGDSDRFFPQRKSVSIPLQEQPHMSPSNLSWPSQTAPCSINPSRNPSRTPSQRAFLDEKIVGIGHRVPSPLSTSIRQVKIVSEAGVESRREDDLSPTSSDKPPVAETSCPSPESRSTSSSKRMKRMRSSENSPRVAPARGSTSPTVEAPSNNVQMQQHVATSEITVVDHRVVKRSNDRHDLSHRLDQANKGCGCTIL